MTRKTKAEPTEKVTVNGETVLLWKANRRLTAEEHEQLSRKLRFEQEQVGVKIVLVPFSVDASAGGAE